MFNRALKNRLERKSQRKYGRLLVLTGARQSGKTTLARQDFPEAAYISLEDPIARPAWSHLSVYSAAERGEDAIEKNRLPHIHHPDRV